MAGSQPRERLLAAAVEQARQGGIADLSLRELAAAIGTSHRMLLYHFGSREGLLVAIAGAIEEAERATHLESGVTSEDARRFWARISDPAMWPTERLFFELYVQALFGRLGDDQFLDSAVEGWIAPVAAAMVQNGGREATARADARLGLAVTRGLLLDLLATGDRAGVTEAYERFLQLHEPSGSPPGQPGAHGLRSLVVACSRCRVCAAVSLRT
jgi:AcrR family transcriptional regulator